MWRRLTPFTLKQMSLVLVIRLFCSSTYLIPAACCDLHRYTWYIFVCMFTIYLYVSIYCEIIHCVAGGRLLALRLFSACSREHCVRIGKLCCSWFRRASAAYIITWRWKVENSFLTEKWWFSNYYLLLLSRTRFEYEWVLTGSCEKHLAYYAR